MTSETRALKRLFTPAEANAALPLVRAIVTDLVQLSRDVIDRRERLEQLKANRARRPHGVYDEELTQIEEELQRDAEQLQGFVDELLELGVEPKSGPEGLVDFPAQLDGRTVYLCWKLGEPEVRHWHELDAGFRGRQPLTPQALGE